MGTLRLDATSNNGFVGRDIGTPISEVFLTTEIAVDSTYLSNLLAQSFFWKVMEVQASDATYQSIGVVPDSGVAKWATDFGSPFDFTVGSPIAADVFYTVEMRITAGSPMSTSVWIDGESVGTITISDDLTDIEFLNLRANGGFAGYVYFRNYKAGTSRGAGDVYEDDFSTDLSGWTAGVSDAAITVTASFTASPTDGIAPLVVDFTDTSLSGESGPLTAWSWDFGDTGTSSSQNPSHTYAAQGVYDVSLTVTGTGSDGSSTTTMAHLVDVTPRIRGRRVGIAFDDGPLVWSPAWTWLDDTTVFPDQFVAGYDTKNGRQTLISQTETGTATVYVNDRQGLFDDHNLSSPYNGKLTGRQIVLQLWNPVTEKWERQFRGLIDNYSYDIDGSAVDANGDPINASIQIECVDIFDYLNGYGLTPTIDGHYPVPAGMEDGVWYDPTSGGIQDRFIAILDDAGLDPASYAETVFQGNVNVIGVKYDADESALTALRDAADAEIPFIANIYVDRYGRFVFRGRYSRFDPDGVAAEPGVNWDFTRWPLGDGKAIEADPTRGQIREISYEINRADLINAALAYPQGIKSSDMPGQVFASATSITANGKHQAPPMSDLLTEVPTSSGYSKLVETGKFAELLVANKKQPKIALTRLVLKSMRPDDARAAATWGAICEADIDHIVNVAVGYPGGTGLPGDSPGDDHYVEGRALTVRPLNPDHDYVECELQTSPAVWSMDTHGVFPAFS